MKTIKITLIVSLFCLLFSACSKKDKTPYNLIAVPKDAKIVLAVNAKANIEKAGLNNYQDFKFYKLIEAEFTGTKGELMKEFLKNTRSSGLNLDQFFIYVCGNNGAVNESGDNLCAGLSFKMDNAKTFEQFLKKVSENDEIPVEEKDGYKMIEIPGNNTNIKWNDKVAVFSANAKDMNVLNADEANSILANTNFKANYSGNDDFFAYFDYESVINFISFIYKQQNGGAKIISSDMIDMYKGMYAISTSNTEKGAIISHFKMLPEEKVDALYKKYPFIKESFNSELYKYLPDKALVATKLSLNPTEIYKLVKQSMTDTTSVQTSNFTAEQMREARKYIEENDAKISEILSIFSGDALFSISGFKNGMTPQIYAVCGINADKTDALEKLIESNKLTKNSDGYYTFGDVPFITNLAIKDGVAYLTTDAEAVKNFMAGKGFSSDITSAKLTGCNIKSDLAVFYLDMNINNYPAMLKMMAGVSTQAKLAITFFEKTQSLVFRSTSKYEGDCSFYLNDNSDYATKIILKFIDSINPDL